MNLFNNFLKELKYRLANRKVVFWSSLLAVILLIGYLLYRYVAPFGKTVFYRFDSKLPGSENIVNLPGQTGSNLKLASQVIKSSQTRFSLNLTSNKNIETIQARIKFKKGPKEIKLGVRGNEKDSFIYEPFYHSFLQDLSWKRIENEDVSFWQRENKYATLSEFLKNPPKDEKVTVYYVDRNKLSSILPSGSNNKEVKTTLDYPLRGSHTLFVRVDKTPLELRIAKQDLNGYEGEDILNITLRKANRIAFKDSVRDDGITDRSGLITAPQEKLFTIKDIDPGIYEINLAFEGGSTDGLISKIELNQEKVVIDKSFFNVDTKPRVVYTNATNSP